jgi:two-component system, OmpR family, KDP operon response regulator KdpE
MDNLMIQPVHKVMIIEDDVGISSLLASQGISMNLDVNCAYCVKDAIDHLKNYEPDLVLLDLGLPDADGKTFIKSFRLNSDNPILVISSRTQESEKVDALNAGADDYLTKPFGLNELKARMNALLRRHQTLNNGVNLMKLGEIEVDWTRRIITKKGEPVNLSPIEFEILNILATSRGKVVTHRNLLAKVWGGAHTDDHHYLRIYMGHLRRKLEHDPTQPQYLLTVAGVGYRLEV